MMDQIWLLGDSLTQGGFEIENKGFAARLARPYPILLRRYKTVSQSLAKTCTLGNLISLIEGSPDTTLLGHFLYSSK
jgi:hypothetical protein